MALDTATAVSDSDTNAKLEKLARDVIDDPQLLDAVMPEVLALASTALWCAAPLFQRNQIVRDAFEDYTRALEEAEDFEAGLIEWDQIDPELTGSGEDRELAAAEIAAQRVNDALTRLVTGGLR